MLPSKPTSRTSSGAHEDSMQHSDSDNHSKRSPRADTGLQFIQLPSFIPKSAHSLNQSRGKNSELCPIKMFSHSVSSRPNAHKAAQVTCHFPAHNMPAEQHFISGCYMRVLPAARNYTTWNFDNRIWKEILGTLPSSTNEPQSPFNIRLFIWTVSLSMINQYRSLRRRWNTLMSGINADWCPTSSCVTSNHNKCFYNSPFFPQ
jgi:hypothetical protein